METKCVSGGVADRWRWASKMMMLGAAVLTVGGGQVSAKERPTWRVTKVVDPITGDSSCTVAAYDRSYFGVEYSRTGYLYPVVEKNSRLGLLVGVSSGGRFRLPTGDILWRVDSLPHRTLLAANNPPDPRNQFATAKTGNREIDQIVEETMKSHSATMATSTMASGTEAQVILDELLRGRTLIYRSAAAAPAYGLPTGRENEVGFYTGTLKKPIPIDESFRAGLRTCGISDQPSGEADAAPN